MPKSKIDFEPLEKAIFTLDEALSKKNMNDLERDGAIQRFEYTFELSWKLIRKTLIALGRANVSSSPKPIFRDALEEGFVEDIKVWFKFLEARNLSAHIYDQDEADRVFKAAKEFLPQVKRVLEKLKNISA